MSCGAPGMCGHRRDCHDKHCPGRHMEPYSEEASRAALKRAMPLIIVALLLALVAVFCE